MANEISNITVGSTNYSIVDAGAVRSAEKGSANGLATLGADGKVPSNQLPSFVDDVIEGYLYNGKFYKESAHTTEIAGEGGKIYVDLATDKTYRYSGSTYVEISSGGSTVSFTSNLTSGTKVGTITINGTETDLYCNNDTNTWRGIQDNLTSDSTVDSLSAKQGKVLKGLVDSKTSNTGTVTSVGIIMNQTMRGTITSSGNIDLGTIFTPDNLTAGENVRIMKRLTPGGIVTGAVISAEDTWRPLGTTDDTACAGNDSRLSDARTANGGNSNTVNGHSVNSDVPANAVFTDTHGSLSGSYDLSTKTLTLSVS